MVLLLGAAAMQAGAQGRDELPEAPQPMISAAGGAAAPSEVRPGEQQAGVFRAPGKADPDKAGSVDTAPMEERKWSRYVDAGEEVPYLTGREKMTFFVREEVRWWSTFPAFVSAGFGQLTDGDPRYGVDKGAFGQRLGAALIRQGTMRFFCDSAFPALTGEDPRYFRKASGGYGSRAGWAAKQALINPKGSAGHWLNISGIAGHLVASAMTPAYYPEPSRSGKVVLTTWLTSIAGNAGNNEFFEFWPDVMTLLHRHRDRSQASGE